MMPARPKQSRNHALWVAIALFLMIALFGTCCTCGLIKGFVGRAAERAAERTKAREAEPAIKVVSALSPQDVAQRDALFEKVFSVAWHRRGELEALPMSKAQREARGFVEILGLITQARLVGKKLYRFAPERVGVQLDDGQPMEVWQVRTEIRGDRERRALLWRVIVARPTSQAEAPWRYVTTKLTKRYIRGRKSWGDARHDIVDGPDVWPAYPKPAYVPELAGYTTSGARAALRRDTDTYVSRLRRRDRSLAAPFLPLITPSMRKSMASSVIAEELPQFLKRSRVSPSGVSVSFGKPYSDLRRWFYDGDMPYPVEINYTLAKRGKLAEGSLTFKTIAVFDASSATPKLKRKIWHGFHLKQLEQRGRRTELTLEFELP